MIRGSIAGQPTSRIENGTSFEGGELKEIADRMYRRIPELKTLRH
jgi:hypothetical protein